VNGVHGAPEVSVIVPARNAAATLGDQLEALARQNHQYAWEVVVVDDCSTDDTGAVARSYSDRLPVRVIRTIENRNAATARNVGVAAARGSYLLFCDADDVVGEGWLSAMVGALREADFVAARMDVDRLNPAWLHGRRGERQVVELQMWEVNGRPYLPHAGAGTVGITRDLYEDLGPFEEGLDQCEGPGPAYCFKAQLAGHRIDLVPDAVVHLRLRPSLPTIYRQSRDWAEWSVALEKMFRPHGMPRSGWFLGVVGWCMLLPRLVRIRSRSELVWWVRRLAWRVGRVRGSIRFRTVAL
jgi:glycosyltransferase involved in cell wall biosynthesis